MHVCDIPLSWEPIEHFAKEAETSSASSGIAWTQEGYSQCHSFQEMSTSSPPGMIYGGTFYFLLQRYNTCELKFLLKTTK